MSIAENIAQVREEMEQACRQAGRDPRDVKLIAVTKYVEEARIAEAFACGLKTVGENHAQEVRDKLTFYKQYGAELHFIGQLQSNKVKYIIGNARLIQSADREKLLVDIDAHAKKLGVVQGVLLQVNIGGEAQKGGADLQDVPYLLELACGLKNLRVEGGHLGGKLALPAADLQMQGLGLWHQRPPVSAPRLRIPDPDRGTGLHTRLQMVSFPHAHDGGLLC